MKEGLDEGVMDDKAAAYGVDAGEGNGIAGMNKQEVDQMVKSVIPAIKVGDLETVK